MESANLSNLTHLTNPKPLTLYSTALTSRKTCYVYLPPSYRHNEDREYPVIYLLHGMNGCETDWTAKGNVHGTATSMMLSGELKESIIVMPSDGGYHTGTFYIDWFDGSGKFEQYFIYDLVPAIDSQFRTLKSKESRMIAGLSMGGYGAFVLSLRNPHLFGAAGSLSGVLGDLAPGKQAEEFARLLGPIHGPYAQDHNLYVLSERRAADDSRPVLYFDCGTEDYLYEGSVSFKHHLDKIGYACRYQEFSGAHTWDYWQEHIVDVFHFFNDFLE
ncbi:MAG TPA: alpha/beta hydrolase family protein [Bacilli bacterium]